MSYDPHDDYYVLFGVPDTASATEIKAAYRARIQHVHPDKPSGNAAAASALNVAYDVLGDREKRAAYDDERRRYLAKVAAEAAEASLAAAKARAARLVKKRARAAGPKLTPKGGGMIRSTLDPAQSVVDVAVENLVHSLRNKQYGKALGWFLLGMASADARRPTTRRPPPRRRPR